MNALTLLQAEYGGIQGTIKSYTGESNIVNSVDQLGNAINKKDIELIKYHLSSIGKWYEQNIKKIHSKSYIAESSQQSYQRNKELIDQLIVMFEEYHLPASAEDNAINESKKTGEPIIFISHRSSDKKYGDALRNFIIGLGVRENQLIYTSHPLHKIPLDKNIYDYLRENINDKVFMIILWSNEYLESPACLNEMGAAWVVQSDYTNIYTPSFSFGNPKYHECAVDTRKMGAVLKNDTHCKTSMLELKDKIQHMFNLPNDEKKTAYLLEQFMKEIGD